MSGRAVPALEDWRTGETITADEWAAITRSARWTIHRHLKGGMIPAFKVGGSWRIPTRWARVQLGEIQDEAYARLEAPAEVEPEVAPPKRGRPRRRAA